MHCNFCCSCTMKHFSWKCSPLFFLLRVLSSLKWKVFAFYAQTLMHFTFFRLWIVLSKQELYACSSIPFIYRLHMSWKSRPEKSWSTEKTKKKINRKFNLERLMWRIFNCCYYAVVIGPLRRGRHSCMQKIYSKHASYNIKIMKKKSCKNVRSEDFSFTRIHCNWGRFKKASLLFWYKLNCTDRKENKSLRKSNFSGHLAKGCVWHKKKSRHFLASQYFAVLSAHPEGSEK